MKHTAYSGIKIFSCNANTELAKSIAHELKIMCDMEQAASDVFESGELGSSEVKTFDDGEINLKINETVRGSDVYIIQPTCAPVNNNLMELLIMTDATRRASAGRITAVIPYFGYARQDRKMRARDPISAKLVADIITTAGADRVLTMDLHCDQIQGFFDIPVDHLRGMPLFYEYYEKKFPDKTDVVIVSPDLGSVARARMLAEKMNVPLAIVDKRRPAPNKSEVMNIIGNVENKTAIILDDMIDTAGSLTNAANSIKEYGANEVYACATHALFSGQAIELIKDCAIKELVILDTIPLPGEKKLDKIKTITVAPIFAAAIFRTHCCLPISKLFG